MVRRITVTELRFWVRVKFRAFGITFGTSEWRPVLPIPVSLPQPIPVTRLVNDRGVLVEVWSQSADNGPDKPA